jgi:hypothetical protein
LHHWGLKKLSAAAGPLDLALLVEVAELYCLVCPPTPGGAVYMEPWAVLQKAVNVAPYPVLAGFAASSSKALLGITEYLVEDVLLVASGAAAGPKASAAGSAPSTSPAANSASSSSQGSSAAEGVPNSGSSSSSSSSKKRRPHMGGRNPGVTLEHRAAWAQDSISTVSWLMWRQDMLQAWEVPGNSLDDLSSLEQEGEVLNTCWSMCWFACCQWSACKVLIPHMHVPCELT